MAEDVLGHIFEIFFKQFLDIFEALFVFLDGLLEILIFFLVSALLDLAVLEFFSEEGEFVDQFVFSLFKLLHLGFLMGVFLLELGVSDLKRLVVFLCFVHLRGCFFELFILRLDCGALALEEHEGNEGTGGKHPSEQTQNFYSHGRQVYHLSFESKAI